MEEEKNVVFDEDEWLPGKHSRRQAHISGLSGLLIRRGWARNAKQADRIMILFAAVFFLGAALVVVMLFQGEAPHYELMPEP